MRSIGFYLAVALFVPAVAVAASPPSPADEVKGEISAALGISPKAAADGSKSVEPPRKSAVEKSAAKVVPRRKSAVRKQGIKEIGSRTDPVPGERLTLRQVTELLKTTRNFAGRNLSGLRLIGMDLTKCNFKGADLSNADLERADLEESNLELADLGGANMGMTDLRITGMTGARLERTRLDGAIWRDGTVCARGSVGSCRE